MNSIRNSLKSKTTTGLVLAACILSLANCNKRETSASMSPDNSGQNKQTQPNAENQKEKSSDLKITQKIRQDVVDDDSLSVAGKNVKIITANGYVTLRGPVETQQDKNSIGDKAASVAGVSNVDNQLEAKNQ